MSKSNEFSVKLPSVGGIEVHTPGELQSPMPPPGVEFKDEELLIYNYMCECLRKAGVEHLTVGITLSTIAQVYVAMVKAFYKCEKDGYEIYSKNGYPSEAPWAARYRSLLGILSQQLPKACLTIPSLARVRKDMGDKSGQDDLFGDLVNHAMSSPQKRSLN